MGDRTILHETFLTDRPGAGKAAALILDERTQSSQALSKAFSNRSYDVIGGDSWAVVEGLTGEQCAGIQAVAVSTSLPGLVSSGESASREIERKVPPLFPMTPILVVGEGNAAPTAGADGASAMPVGRSLILARLQRPVDEVVLSEAIESVCRFRVVLDSVLQRHLFRNQALYLDEPIARIIHDLNNQITGLKGGIDLLGYSIDMIRDPETQNKFRRYMEQFILPSLGHIEALIQNWRQLRESRTRPASAASLVEAARRAIALAASPPQQLRVVLNVLGKPIPLTAPAFPDAEPVYCMADLDQLALALANIVQNALEATESRQEGRVALEIDHAPDNMVALRVFDNGEGICEEIRPHIWRSFFSTKRKLGLGLSIAKQVIDKLQGQIECVPSHLGGAGIQILLPSPAGRK